MSCDRNFVTANALFFELKLRTTAAILLKKAVASMVMVGQTTEYSLSLAFRLWFLIAAVGVPMTWIVMSHCEIKNTSRQAGCWVPCTTGGFDYRRPCGELMAKPTRNWRQLLRIEGAKKNERVLLVIQISCAALFSFFSSFSDRQTDRQT
jgi:hypothetical protein